MLSGLLNPVLIQRILFNVLIFFKTMHRLFALLVGEVGENCASPRLEKKLDSQTHIDRLGLGCIDADVCDQLLVGIRILFKKRI